MTSLPVNREQQSRHTAVKNTVNTGFFGWQELRLAGWRDGLGGDGDAVCDTVNVDDSISEIVEPLHMADHPHLAETIAK